MKIIVTIAILLTVSLTMFAQNDAEKQVANTIEQLRKAMVDADSAQLVNLTAPALSYGHSSGKVQNKKEFIEKIVDGSSDFVTMDLTEQTITISDNIAIVRHRLDAKTNDAGKPGEVHLYILLIWQKQKTGWKLLARQAVKIV